MEVRGRLVAFEGIDGSGKTTQARIFANETGAVFTSEPGSTPLGAQLRRLLLDPDLPDPSVRAEALLMAADRAQHVFEVIEPELSAGIWVVTDRFSPSTLAYQGYGRGLQVSELRTLVNWASGGLEPDLIVLLDVPLDLARSRISRGGDDRLERLDIAFHERVSEGYRSLARESPERWVIVDGVGTKAEIASHVRDLVAKRIGPIPVRR
ncbi:MAG TPA: dTMP kinase [Acidimicrobiales bacterium]|nr:dTMP kinase [Acidimicrobiales bacterium]